MFITAKKEISILAKKQQKNVSFNLLSSYKLELGLRKINEKYKDGANRTVKVARFYMLDETINEIVLDYLSWKKIDEFVKRVHYLNPNIYIIGFNYKYTVIQK